MDRTSWNCVLILYDSGHYSASCCLVLRVLVIIIIIIVIINTTGFYFVVCSLCIFVVAYYFSPIGSSFKWLLTSYNNWVHYRISNSGKYKESFNCWDWWSSMFTTVTCGMSEILSQFRFLTKRDFIKYKFRRMQKNITARRVFVRWLWMFYEVW